MFSSIDEVALLRFLMKYVELPGTCEQLFCVCDISDAMDSHLEFMDFDCCGSSMRRRDL